jgi:hypothetical protein
MRLIAVAAAVTALPAFAQTPPAPAPAPVTPAPQAVPAPVQASPAPAPDYAQDAAWLCRPGRADPCASNQDVTVVQANGRTKVERFRRPASPPPFDCFYVYPTVSNDPSGNSDMTAGPEEIAVATSQAARFASKCRVFAPLYRQVTLTALRQLMAGGTPPVDRGLGLRDVFEAWNDYLRRDNKGRGVVLIGHSQGSGVLKELIARYIEGQPVQRNVISAMLIGTNVAVPQGQAVGGDFKRLPLCTTVGQYGCVVTYVSFRSDSPPPANSRFGKVPQPGMIAGCVNPAAIAGGKATADAILAARGGGQSAAAQAPWTTTNAAITTPFVRVPGLISTECVNRDGFSYLSVTVNADPVDARTDTISGDVTANGTILRDWGLHLIDMPVVMGDLVNLAERQAMAWRGVTHNARPQRD